MRLDGSVLQAGTRLFVFLSLAAVILFFNYSLELSEPLKPVLSYFFYVTEFLLVFFILSRRRLPAFLQGFRNPSFRGAALWALLTLLFFGLRLQFFVVQAARLPLTLLGLSALFLALFGLSSARRLISMFRKELVVSLAFFAFVNLLGMVFYTNWLFLGSFTARVVAKLIGLTLGNPVLDLSNPDYPIVGREPFVAIIYPECSGIQSLLLFTALFLLAAAVDLPRIDRRKALLAYLLGMAGMFVVTVLRIYFIIAAGVLFSVDFAIQFVHSTISLILFVAYFTLFWRVALRRIRKS